MIIHHKSNWSLKFDVYFDWFECIHNTRESNLDKARLNTPILINRFYEFVAPDSFVFICQNHFKVLHFRFFHPKGTLLTCFKSFELFQDC